MSYMTVYSLCVVENRTTNSEDDIQQKIEKFLCDIEVPTCVLNGSYESSWDTHEADIKLLSCKIPNVLFCLYGEGEDRNDLWDKYFLNGKMQACYATVTITVPEFNEDQMT